MTIEEIKKYEDIDKYTEEVGYENLTDEDIRKLCVKVCEISDERIERIQKRNLDPMEELALLMFEEGIANSKCYSLCNCTSERRIKNMERIEKAMEEVDRKEAMAYIKIKDRYIL